MNAIVLDDVPESVWTSFQSGDWQKDRAAEPYSQVLQRWQRAQTLGASAQGLTAEEILHRGESLQLRREQVESIQHVGSDILERTAARLATKDFVTLFADREGVIVKTMGGGSFANGARNMRLIDGAQWNEASRGTNALGVSLAEGQPAAVIGRAHYGKLYHSLCCYAAPIRDADGNIIGTIDATSAAHNADPSVMVIVSSAAQAIEELLRLNAYAGVGSSLVRVLNRTIDHMREPALLIESPGKIARLNESAQVLLGTSVGQSLQSALGIDWLVLSREAMHGSRGGLILQLPQHGHDGRQSSVRLRAEPIVASSGSVLAVLVFIDVLQNIGDTVWNGTIFDKNNVATRTNTQVTTQGWLTRDTARPTTSCDPFAPLFSQDERVTAAIEWARQAAPSELPMMLLAEAGAGKEVLAQAIHRASRRADGPLLMLNCHALSPHQVEHELFGTVGALMSPQQERRGQMGMLQSAEGGTLFIDEATDLPLHIQQIILHFLDHGTYIRPGENKEMRSDVRVLLGTSSDFTHAVSSGKFLHELFYRLKGAVIRLPPLRERADILPLARHLLEQQALRAGWPVAPQLSDAAAARLARHTWPGNIRELMTVLDVALVSSRGIDTIDAKHLPKDLEMSVPRALPLLLEGSDRAGNTNHLDKEHTKDHPKDNFIEVKTGTRMEIEGELLRKTLNDVNFNISEASRRIGVARTTLYRMMRRHNIQDPNVTASADVAEYASEQASNNAESHHDNPEEQADSANSNTEKNAAGDVETNTET